MATPAFNDAADKIRREEAAADKAREAAESDRARADLAARFPGRYQTPKTLDEAQAMDDPKGARMNAFRPTVGDPSGKTPAQADELAMIRASDEYTRAHRNYLERARKGETLTGVSHADGTVERYFPDKTAEGDRNNTRTPGPFNNERPLSERLKDSSYAEKIAGGFGAGRKDFAVYEVDNLARREAIEAYDQERARAKRQSQK